MNIPGAYNVLKQIWKEFTFSFCKVQCKKQSSFFLSAVCPGFLKKGSVDKLHTHEIRVLLKTLYVVNCQAKGIPQSQKSELSQQIQKAQKPSVLSSDTCTNISFCLKYFLFSFMNWSYYTYCEVNQKNHEDNTFETHVEPKY